MPNRIVKTSEATYRQPKHGWTCYHCGETFSTPGSARDHFGATPQSVPGCVIKAGEERGLLMALRKTEDELSYWRNRASRVEYEVETLRGQLEAFERYAPDANTLRCLLDTAQGRVITADALITAVREKAPELYAEVVR